MKTLSANALCAILMIGTAGFSCNRSSESGSEEVRVEMENHIESSSEVETVTLGSGDQVIKVPGDGWLSIDVPILVPGRYKTEVRLAAGSEVPVTCWLEDYIDNKDGRAYNVTGSMEIPVSDQKDQLSIAHVDGTPLNSGIHKMKLHIQGGEASVDWINFTLLKEHKGSPEKLTQKTEGDKWVVVWSDEFEEGDLPDPEKWIYDIGDWGWGNNELQYYTEGRKENARIENGNLIIEAHKNPNGEKWTSARLTTRGKTSFVYGRIEMKAKGEVDFTVPDQLGFLTGTGLFMDGDIEATVNLPASFSFSLAHRVSKFTWLADVTWTGWSSFEELRIKYDNPAQPDSVTTYDWEDTMRYSVGLDYLLSNRWVLRTGLAYDETPVPDKERRTPRLPGNDRTCVDTDS